MKLYNYFRSSASYRVRLALNLKSLPFDYQAVHLVNNGGEQNHKDYVAMTPMKQVPTLVNNDFALSQSLVIMEYLDEVHPEIKLFPYALKDRMRVKEFCEVINSGIQPLINLKVLQTLESMFKANPLQKDEWTHVWMMHGMKAVEELLQRQSGKYSFGNSITAADCFLVPQVFAANRFHFKLDRFPNILRVYNSLAELPAVQRAHPEKQPDYKA
jgi:maleylacetoacetate isomerase